jgi:hypothetical protein
MPRMTRIVEEKCEITRVNFDGDYENALQLVNSQWPQTHALKARARRGVVCERGALT